MKLIINPKYKHLKPFIEKIPYKFHEEGETIYKSRNEIKVVGLHDLTLNIKEYKVPLFFNRFIYSIFRKPKCVRAYEYAIKLREKGIETPEPVAYIVLSSGGLMTKSYFVSIQSLYDRNFYEFGKGGIKDREEILIEFAKYTAYLHDSGVYHCDYSPGNILFSKLDGKYNFSIVDINRMKFGKVSFKSGCMNFSRLWGQKDFFELIATEYAKARGFDINKTKKKILYYRAFFWIKFGRKHNIPFNFD